MAKSDKKPARQTSQPLPGIVDDSGPWTIRESLFGDASIDRRSRVVTAPLGITPQERQARNHEMLHLKFSPKVPPKLPAQVDPLVYQACEDYRVNKRGRGLGIRQDVPNLTDADITRWRTAWKDKPLVAAAALVAASETPDFEPLRDAFMEDFTNPKTGDLTRDGRRAWTALDTVMYDYMYSAKPAHKKAVDAAYYLSKLLAPKPPKPEKSGAESKGMPSEGEIERDTAEGLEELIDFGGRELIDELRKREEKGDKLGGFSDKMEYGKTWGTMEIVTPELPLILPGKMRARRWKPTDTGSVFRYAHRYCGDGSVFAYKGIREGGCTLLIDVSGSMSLSPADILKIMEYMPAAQIATYCGNAHSGKGWLTIIGRKGRRAEPIDMRPKSGGNVVDGPALLWLASQQGPRYWVCDGYVTGIGDETGPVLTADAFQIAERNHIMRLDSMHDVIEKFKHLRSGR